ncbi:MAG: hypothetical protein IT564_12330 [Rhodospirillales bacterium]|nr:hypothetical protein [Rhodospirillales bacterium]
MADFEYPFTSAGTPNSFPIPNAAGVVGIDSTGLLTPASFGIGPDMTVLLTATKTDAEVAAAMHAWLTRYGNKTDGGAGGRPTQVSLQVDCVLTEVAAAD